MPQIGTTSKLSVNVVNVGRFVVNAGLIRYFHMLDYLHCIFPSVLLLVLLLFSIKCGNVVLFIIAANVDMRS